MADTLNIAIRKFDPFEAQLRRKFEDWQRLTGSDLGLNLVSLDLNPLTETLFTHGGLKDGTWDIALVVTDWIADAVAGGSLRDLAPMMVTAPVEGFPDGWSPALLRFQQVGDALYGIPYHDGPECLVYRTDLFADPAEQAAFEGRYGYPLRAPRTWDEFLDVAHHFTDAAGGRYGTIVAAYPDGHNAVYDFCLQLWSRGGELHDEAGLPTLSTPQAVASLDFYRALVADRSATPPGQEGVDSVASGARFASGEIAMMVNWFGFASNAEVDPNSPVRGKVGVAPLPVGDGGRPVSLNVYWVLAIAAGSSRPDDAWSFIRHCATPENDRLTTLMGGVGCRMSTWADREVNTQVPFSHRLADLHEYARELPRSRDWPAVAHLVDAAVQRAIATDDPSADILREAQEAAGALRLAGEE